MRVSRVEAIIGHNLTQYPAVIASRYYQAAIKMVICFLHDEVEDADDVFSDWDEMVGAQPDACGRRRQ